MEDTTRDWDALASRLGSEAVADGAPTRWFEELWSAAARDEVDLPWDRRSPLPPVAEHVTALGMPPAAVPPSSVRGSARMPSCSRPAGGARRPSTSRRAPSPRSVPATPRARSTTGSPTCSRSPPTSWAPSASSSRSSPSRRSRPPCARQPRRPCGPCSPPAGRCWPCSSSGRTARTARRALRGCWTGPRWRRWPASDVRLVSLVAAPPPRPARRAPALGRRPPPRRLTGTYAAAMTFSIAARDGDAWGVAVASRFLAVGAVVPRVRPGVGAVATQSHARVAYLDEVLDALDGRHSRVRGPRRGRRR